MNSPQQSQDYHLVERANSLAQQLCRIDKVIEILTEQKASQLISENQKKLQILL